MAPYSSTLAWKIPWMEEPGRLQSMRSLRVGHDWATSLSLFTFMHWRRKWQPTPVFLPGESQGQEPGGLPSMGWVAESDTTEVTQQQLQRVRWREHLLVFLFIWSVTIQWACNKRMIKCMINIMYACFSPVSWQDIKSSEFYVRSNPKIQCQHNSPKTA